MSKIQKLSDFYLRVIDKYSLDNLYFEFINGYFCAVRNRGNYEVLDRIKVNGLNKIIDDGFLYQPQEIAFIRNCYDRIQKYELVTNIMKLVINKGYFITGFNISISTSELGNETYANFRLEVPEGGLSFRTLMRTKPEFNKYQVVYMSTDYSLNYLNDKEIYKRTLQNINGIMRVRPIIKT